MKGHTDNDLCRHYRFRGFNRENIEIKEAHESLVSLGIDYDDEMVWADLTRDKAAKLATLLRYFSMHGTLPVPKKQEPPKVKTTVDVPKKVYV